MAVFYNDGETKRRPGVYQRHTNTGFNALAGSFDGVCAIPIHSNWGPVGEVVRCNSIAELEKKYGTGTYGENYTVPAAAAMFEGGASTVYAYRLGTGGTAATIGLKDSASGSATAVNITAKYPGIRSFTCTVRAKLGNNTQKECIIYDGTTVVESYTFAAGSDVNEAENLVAAAAKSENFKFEKANSYSGTGVLAAVVNSAFTAGTNPNVTNSDYSTAFAALEPFHYNTIALDVDDDENMSLSMMLQSYLDSAYKLGKMGIAVVGEKSTVAFATRCNHAKAFNDARVAYLGGGYAVGDENRDGVLAVCYTAGLISATPANMGITHTVINGATGLLETPTYAQYEEAIDSGMIMLSVSPDGQIWYDSGITTLIAPEDQSLDDGWKKIRRVKCRFEMIDRIDRALAPKVGRVNNDTDGVSDIIQSAQRILDAMVTEGKLMAGASFTEDTNNPHEGDSAWFIIQADDIDSLEKIYLQYQFRYSQNS